jgi:uncharacterized protein YkwD
MPDGAGRAQRHRLCEADGRRPTPCRRIARWTPAGAGFSIVVMAIASVPSRRHHDIALCLVAIVLVFVDPPAAAQSPRRPDVEAATRAIVQGTNDFRASQGLGATRPEARLGETARRFAESMASTDRYGHEADGSTPAQRAQASGYAYCALAENIGYVMKSSGFSAAELADAFVEGWKNSPPHRKNMLEPAVTETGIGLAQSQKTQRWYAVQLLGRPRAAAIRFSIVNDTAGPVEYRLGDEVYALPPRVTRTHQQCTDQTVLAIGSGRDAARTTPHDGARYHWTLPSPSGRGAERGALREEG